MTISDEEYLRRRVAGEYLIDGRTPASHEERETVPLPPGSEPEPSVAPVITEEVDESVQEAMGAAATESAKNAADIDDLAILGARNYRQRQAVELKREAEQDAAEDADWRHRLAFEAERERQLASRDAAAPRRGRPSRPDRDPALDAKRERMRAKREAAKIKLQPMAQIDPIATSSKQIHKAGVYPGKRGPRGPARVRGAKPPAGSTSLLDKCLAEAPDVAAEEGFGLRSGVPLPEDFGLRSGVPHPEDFGLRKGDPAPEYWRRERERERERDPARPQTHLKYIEDGLPRPASAVVSVEAGVRLPVRMLVLQDGERIPIQKHGPVSIEAMARVVDAEEYRRVYSETASGQKPHGHLAYARAADLAGAAAAAGATAASRFTAAAYLLFRSGNVPGPVAQIWRDHTLLRRHLPRDDSYGLEDACAIDARVLTENACKHCGKSTLDHQVERADGGTDSKLGRLRCQGHREPVCARYLGKRMALRIEQQLLRDKDCGRAWSIMMTLTTNRDRYLTEIGAMKGLLVLVRAFIKRLRKRFGVLAFFVAVESHTLGWPHVHLLIRSREMMAALVREAGAADVDALREQCSEAYEEAEPKVRKWEETGRRGRKPKAKCPFSRIKMELNDMAVDLGFGRAGFYMEPVRTIRDVAPYMTKEQLTPSRSGVAAEVADDANGGIKSIAAEVTKQKQIGILPRHFRRWRPSGKAGDMKDTTFFCDEEGASSGVKSTPVKTVNLVIHHCPPEEVRDHLREHGVTIAGEHIVADMSGTVPSKGEKRPRELHSFMVVGGRPPMVGDIREVTDALEGEESGAIPWGADLAAAILDGADLEEAFTKVPLRR